MPFPKMASFGKNEVVGVLPVRKHPDCAPIAFRKLGLRTLCRATAGRERPRSSLSSPALRRPGEGVARAEAPRSPVFPSSRFHSYWPHPPTPGWTYAVHVVFSLSASKGQKSQGKRSLQRRRRDISVELPTTKDPAPYGASSSGAQFLLPAGLKWRSLTTIAKKLAMGVGRPFQIFSPRIVRRNDDQISKKCQK
jgi:hypothetical protein